MASPGETVWDMRHGNDEFQLMSSTTKEFHRGNLALAIGPYNMNFTGGGQNFGGITGLGSLYGSLLVSDSTRLLYFAEIAGTPQMFTDWGIYFSLESAKGLDQRLSFNLLLGIHGAAFFSSGNGNPSSLSYTGHVDGPQGFELSYTDPRWPRNKGSIGAFIQPQINVNSYYNIWLRWSRPKYFVEINYLNWVQQLDQTYSSNLVGLSVGWPVFGFD